MIKDKVSINIISSFNHANFIGLLENNNDFKWQINDSNYNQIFQILSDRKLNIWKKKSDISLIWSTPESISPEFKKLLNHEKHAKNMKNPKNMKIPRNMKIPKKHEKSKKQFREILLLSFTLFLTSKNTKKLLPTHYYFAFLYVCWDSFPLARASR